MARTNADMLRAYLQKKTEGAKSKYARIITASQVGKIEYIKTGIPEFDIMFGGIARGRHTMIYGGPGGGKSTLIAKMIGNLQKQGLGVFLAEPEETFEPDWAAKQGVDLDNLLMTRETSFGTVMDAVIDMAGSGYTDVIFIDSLAALKLKELDKKTSEDDFMALMARRLSINYFPKVNEILANNRVAIVYVSQKRSNLDPYGAGIEEYPGGNALKHYLSLALNIRRSSPNDLMDHGDRFKAGDERLGFYTKIKAVKTKLPVVTENESMGMSFFHGKGFDSSYGLLDLAITYDILKRKGPHYTMIKQDKSEYSQIGMNNVLRDIQENETFRNDISALLTYRKENGPVEPTIEEEIPDEATIPDTDKESSETSAEGTATKTTRKKKAR